MMYPQYSRSYARASLTTLHKNGAISVTDYICLITTTTTDLFVAITLLISRNIQLE
jgi:hypothetical protein